MCVLSHTSINTIEEQGQSESQDIRKFEASHLNFESGVKKGVKIKGTEIMSSTQKRHQVREG